MLASADTGQGRFLIVQLCEGHDQPARAVNLDTGEEIDTADIPEPTRDPVPDNQPCVFAAAPHVATPVAVAEPVIIVVTTDVPAFVAGDVRPGRGIAAPPPPSTGPPILI